MELLEAIRKLPQISSLSQTDLQCLADAVLVQRHPDGHLVIEEDRKADTIYVLLEGRIAVTRGSSQRELAVIHPVSLFGIIALADDGPRSASCRAAGPVTVASLPVNVARMLMRSNAPIAQAMQRMLVGQLTGDYRRLRARLKTELFAQPT